MSKQEYDKWPRQIKEDSGKTFNIEEKILLSKI